MADFRLEINSFRPVSYEVLPSICPGQPLAREHAHAPHLYCARSPITNQLAIAPRTSRHLCSHRVPPMG